jgi:hypothetical protein
MAYASGFSSLVITNPVFVDFGKNSDDLEIVLLQIIAIETKKQKS